MQENDTGNSANAPGIPQVVLNAPRLEYLIKSYDVSPGLCSPRHEAALLHDFVQAMTNSTRRRWAPIADHGCEPAVSVADSCFNFFPLITFRTRATNRCVDRDRLTLGLRCTISCMKKKFSKRIGYRCTVHSSLNSRCGDRSQVPKLPP
jgi:hypothetical protein